MLHSGPDAMQSLLRSPGAAPQLACLFHTSASSSAATQRKVESKLVSSCLLLLDDDMSSLNSTRKAYNRGDTELSFQVISALRPPCVPEERFQEILMPRKDPYGFHIQLCFFPLPFLASGPSKCANIV